MSGVLRLMAALVLAASGLFALYETIEAPGSQVFGPTIVHGRGHVVALTFDDGPSNTATPRILALLENTHVRATFFVVGRAVRAHPELLRRMLRDGDEIGNHTQTHAHLNFLLRRDAIEREITATQFAIRSATGQQARYLRPPFGARDFAALDVAQRCGLQVVMWTAMLGDEPSHAAVDELSRGLLLQVHDGAVIVLHDGDQGRPDAGGRMYESAAAGTVIAQLKARGYRFVTVSQLVAGERT